MEKYKSLSHYDNNLSAYKTTTERFLTTKKRNYIPGPMDYNINCSGNLKG